MRLSDEVATSEMGVIAGFLHGRISSTEGFATDGLRLFSGAVVIAWWEPDGTISLLDKTPQPALRHMELLKGNFGWVLMFGADRVTRRLVTDGEYWRNHSAPHGNLAKSVGKRDFRRKLQSADAEIGEELASKNADASYRQAS